MLFSSADEYLHLAVIIPTLTSWPEARQSVGAISLAVEMVNAHVDHFGGKQLRFQWREADCDSSDSMAQLSLMFEAGPVDAVIGPDCNLACESSAYLTAGRNLLQISYRHAASRTLPRAPPLRVDVLCDAAALRLCCRTKRHTRR